MTLAPFNAIIWLHPAAASCILPVCRATSATSRVILRQFKTCVILLEGYLLFSSDPGFVSIVGAVMALSGMSVYTTLNLRDSHDKATLLPNHNLSSTAKTKSVEEKPLIDEDKPAII